MPSPKLTPVTPNVNANVQPTATTNATKNTSQPAALEGAMASLSMKQVGAQAGTPPRAVLTTQDNVQRNLEQATQRMNNFFGEQPAGLQAQDKQKAAQTIDDYIRTKTKPGEVPPELKAFMIDLHAMTGPIDRAIRPGNVLSRTKGNDGNLQLNDQKTFEASALKFLGEKIQEKVEENVSARERPLNKSARVLANSMLMGTGACNHMAEMGATQLAMHLQKNPELQDKVKFEFLSTPFAKGKEDGRTDHRYVGVTFTDNAGKEHALSFDPHTPHNKKIVMLEKDSDYSGGFKNSASHLNSATAINTLKSTIPAHMEQHTKEMPSVAAQESQRFQGKILQYGFKDAVEGNRQNVLRDISPDKQHPQADTLHGWIDQSHSQDPLSRRNSVTDTSKSPLFDKE